MFVAVRSLTDVRRPRAPLVFLPSAVRAGVGQELTIAREAQAERRCERRLTHYRQVVKRVVEAERETDDRHRCADLDVVAVLADARS